MNTVTKQVKEMENMTNQIERIKQLLESKNAKNIRVNEVSGGTQCLIANKGAATFYIYFKADGEIWMNEARNSKDKITRNVNFEKLENKIKKNASSIK